MQLRSLTLHFLSCAALACLASTAQAAGDVRVTVLGKVEYNSINPPPLGNVQPMDAVALTFLLDSTQFVNSGSFPTRGYVVDSSSFQMVLGSVTMSLASPFPPGLTPYFVLRDNDPAVDGFMLSTNIDFPLGVALNQAGAFGPFINDFYVTYRGTTLASLDIFGALGSYDFTGLSVFNWTVDDGPFQPLGIVFSSMDIACEPNPAANYCTALTSSSGCVPSMGSSGSASLSSPGSFQVLAAQVETGQNGLLFFGLNGPASLPFFGGTLCVNPNLYRLGVQNSGGTGPCTGQLAATLGDMLAEPSGGPLIVPGAKVWCQAWFRDPPAAQTVGLSDGLMFSVCP